MLETSRHLNLNYSVVSYKAAALLFVSYINELADVLGQYNVTVKFFADDLKMYAEIKTNLEADLFQDALDRLSNWAND